MMDQNTCFAYLNMELPDDIRRLKEAGYYDAAIARIDACLAEDWTASQNQPLHPQGALPVNPTPHGVDAWRQGLLAHREILRRLPRDYTLTADQLLNKLQATLRDFTAEEFAALDAAGQMDWRFVEGQKRYIYRAAETLVATHPDLAARQLDPPVPERSWDRFEPQHDQMVRTGAVSADITLRTSIGMTDETFARALAAAKAEGRNTVHVKVWLPLPAACPAQSNITLDSFTAQPTYIAPETAPQRTAYWEADLAENCRFGAQYSYRSTAYYAAPLEMQADPVQPDFDTAEQLPHIAFTPYMKALAAQLTEGLSEHTAAFAAAYAARDTLGLLGVLLPMEELRRDQLSPILEQWRTLLADALAAKSGLPAALSLTASVCKSRTGAELLAGVQALQTAIDDLKANVGSGPIVGWLTIALR